LREVPSTSLMFGPREFLDPFQLNAAPYSPLFFEVRGALLCTGVPERPECEPLCGVRLRFQPFTYRDTLFPVDEQRAERTILTLRQQFETGS